MKHERCLSGSHRRRINALLHPPRSETGLSTSDDAFAADEEFMQNNVPILPMKSGVSHGTELSSYWRSSLATNPEYLSPLIHSPVSKVRPSNWDGSESRGDGNACSGDQLASFGEIDDERYVNDGFMNNEVIRAGALTVPAGGNGMFAQGSAFRAARTAALK
jgi:hypothetical protein